MAPHPKKYQYDETLLYQGKYGEWFRSSLSAEAQAWVNRPQCPECKRTVFQAGHKCECLRERYKPESWINRDGLAWRLQAACKGADLDIFFPDNEALFNQPDAKWRAFCGCCPVAGPCILFAADSKTSSGVYGGKYLRPSHRPPSQDPFGTGKPGRRKKAVEPP